MFLLRHCIAGVSLQPAQCAIATFYIHICRMLNVEASTKLRKLATFTELSVCSRIVVKRIFGDARYSARPLCIVALKSYNVLYQSLGIGLSISRKVMVSEQ